MRFKLGFLTFTAAFLGLSSSGQAADFLQTILGTPFVEKDLRDSVFAADVCAGARFQRVDARGAIFKYSRVFRSCDFENSQLQGAQFFAFLYSQDFKNSNLKGAVFHLGYGDGGIGVSEVTFENCNMEGVKFYGDTSRVKIIGGTCNLDSCKPEEESPPVEGPQVEPPVTQPEEVGQGSDATPVQP